MNQCQKTKENFVSNYCQNSKINVSTTYNKYLIGTIIIINEREFRRKIS